MGRLRNNIPGLIWSQLTAERALVLCQLIAVALTAIAARLDQVSSHRQSNFALQLLTVVGCLAAMTFPVFPITALWIACKSRTVDNVLTLLVLEFALLFVQFLAMAPLCQ